MEQNEKLYAKGFNEGYLLSKHEPDLLKSLLASSHPKNDYFEGLKFGGKQHDKEKILEQLKKSQELAKDQSKGLSH